MVPLYHNFRKNQGQSGKKKREIWGMTKIRQCVLFSGKYGADFVKNSEMQEKVDFL